MTSFLMPTYKPLPVDFEKGEGVWLIDKNNNRVLDALAGIAVSSLGHSHPKLVKAITEQANKLIHTSNLVNVPQQHKLAEKLCNLAKMEQAFFCNSGAEANECAIKLARMYAHKNNINNPQIIVMEKAFHGRTMATISASGSRKVQAGFEPLVQGFLRVPFNDIAAIEEISRNNKNVVAILVEPIQGEGGLHLPAPDYLPKLREICTNNKWLFMLDEVQSGIGRTGKWFGHQHYDNCTPDVMSLAKGLGGGIPIGACLTKGLANDLLQFGNHGTTFGGNPLCSHVASTVLEVIEEDNLCTNAARLGQKLIQGLREVTSNLPQVISVRGQGLWVGIELNRPCREVLNIGLQHGVLFSVTAESVIRLAPPLIYTDEHVEILLDKLPKIIEQFGIN
jgi:acetylornithine/N-succinyldiaminopimelate aminotransferase